MSDSALVVILFGPKTHKPTMHRDLLLQIPRFAEKFKSIQPTSKEAIPELLFHSFPKSVGDWLAAWLYFKDIPCDASEFVELKGSKAKEVSCKLIDAYCFAQTMGMEEWSNHLVDTLMEFDAYKFPLVIQCRVLRGTRYRNSKLLDLMLATLATSIHCKGWEHCKGIDD